MTSENYSDLFSKHFSFWGHLSSAEKEFFLENTASMHYQKGTCVHNGDADCIGILLVTKGKLRTYLLSEEGRDVTIFRLFPGNICVLSASCMLDAITFDVFIDAEEDTDVLLVNSSAFHEIAEKNIYVKCFAYQTATEHFSDVMWAIEQILFMGISKRLAIFLWDECSKNHTDKIPLTHEQIAKYIGTAREVVSRMLKYFSDKGIVELYRGGVKVIDKEKLRSIIWREK